MMVDTSRMRERIRLPLVIPVNSYLKDHHFEGKIILPAVEVLQRLAGSVRSYRSDAYVRCMQLASFDRFLHIAENSQEIKACQELEVYESGRIVSKLVTTGKIKGSAMTRTKIHAAVSFMPVEESIAGTPVDLASARDGIFYRVPSRKLYRDLVPFGPSFQNVRDDLLLSERGAVARVYAADHPAPSEPLGSPFPLDGAMHAACAWGQRFHHVVAFPVGFERRLIIKPTVTGETYRCTILPVPGNGESLKFDIWIHDATGNLREEIKGVIMRDVFGGRIRPPDWIVYKRTAGIDH
jgi:hypothetical protein